MDVLCCLTSNGRGCYIFINMLVTRDESVRLLGAYSRGGRSAGYNWPVNDNWISIGNR